jgi:hypothetical protein
MDTSTATFLHDVWPVLWPTALGAIAGIATWLNHRSNASAAVKDDIDRLIDATVKEAHNITPEAAFGQALSLEKASEVIRKGVALFKQNGGPELLSDSQAIKRIAAEVRTWDAMPPDFLDHVMHGGSMSKPFDFDLFMQRLPGIIDGVVDKRLAPAKTAVLGAQGESAGRPAEGQAA